MLPCNTRFKKRQFQPADSSWFIPHTGAGYAVLGMANPGLTDNHRSYLQGALQQPLRAGCTYRVSAWVRLCGTRDGGPVAYARPVASDRLAAYFTVNRFGTSSTAPLLVVPAQAELLPPGTFVTDTVAYRQVSATFVAQGGERYFTLGNFQFDAATGLRRLLPGTYPVAARYALDDIAVEAVPPAGVALALGPAPWLGGCPGSAPAVLTAPPGFVAYRWNTGQTTRSIAIGQPGRYVVTADFGCGTLQDSVDVRRYSPAQTPLLGLAAPPAPLCPGQPLTLTARPGFADYRWADGPTGPTRAFGQPGRYRLSARTADGCLVRDSVDLALLPAIALPARLPDTLVCQQVGLRYALPTPAPGTDYTWNTDPAGPVLRLLPGAAGTYTLTARTRCETRTATLRVTTQDCAPLLTVPNVVTPNGDGLNDEFRVLAPTPRPLRLQVFDRWGRQVFGRDDYRREWPGEPRPPAGVYYYLLTDSVYGRRYRGWVELVY